MPELTLLVHRESQESREELVPVVSVDLLDPWDPPAWLDPLASLDARYETTPLSVDCRVELSTYFI